ncbi:MAG: hypothetical protein ACOYL5_11095 [Phototrophicaceae bacterium]|jgi:hypothetical protein
MENYVLSPELTRRLLAFAAEQQRTPDEVLEVVLPLSKPAEVEETDVAAQARVARTLAIIDQADLRFGAEVTTHEGFKDRLREEYTDYLISRMKDYETDEQQ